jgi:SAM-dependent methyltransferase/uncharacterized protein YbaR (Trm112 family)
MTERGLPEALGCLVCPRDRLPLERRESLLVCPHGHDFPIVDEVPVLLADDCEQTIGVAEESIVEARRAARGEPRGDPLFVGTLGINAQEKAQLVADYASGQAHMDPVARFMIGATNGILYRNLIGKIDEYPIPELRLPVGNGKRLLDIGCNWGRWSIAASELEYRTVGLDPSLGAIMAAKRITRDLGLPVDFVVGDARFLPFADNTFDAVFSYSVLQHFSKGDVATCVSEIGRVLKPAGTSLIQMPNFLGMRCLFHQAKRLFRQPRGFEVRYWATDELRRVFSSAIGPTRLSVDCFFGIGLQPADARFMPPARRTLIRVSELLRKLSDRVPLLPAVADSLYVESVARQKS